MDDAGIDLLVVLAPVHINYLIGTPAKGYQEFQALFFPREPEPLTVLTRLCEVPCSRPSHWPGHPGLGRTRAEDPIAAIRQIMVKKGYLSRRVGLEVPACYLHPHDYQKLVAVLGKSLVMDATHLIDRRGRHGQVPPAHDRLRLGAAFRPRGSSPWSWTADAPTPCRR